MVVVGAATAQAGNMGHKEWFAVPVVAAVVVAMVLPVAAASMAAVATMRWNTSMRSAHGGTIGGRGSGGSMHIIYVRFK